VALTSPPYRSAQLPPPQAPPAGWYPDPYGWPIARYFDGRMWTHHTAQVAPPPAVRVPHSVLPLQVAVGAVVVLAVSLIASRILLDQLVRYDWSIVVYAAISVLVGYGPSVWWCLYASDRWGSGDRRTDLGLRFRWSDLGWGPLVWVTAVFCEIVVATLITVFNVPFTSNTEGIGELDVDRAYVITLLVTAVVAAPIVEEMIFRGLMLRGLLSRMSAWLAVGVQGLVFGAVHVDPVRGTGNIGLVLVLSAVGIVFGGAAYLLRRIGPTILAHAILNAVVMVIVLFVDIS
jgi:membrane protease YdiL (CAAX protease family)